jgi:hypothetical protein
VVRSVLEHMRREPAAFKRVVHFYLLDAVLAVRKQRAPVFVSVQKEGRRGRGGSLGGGESGGAVETREAVLPRFHALPQGPRLTLHLLPSWQFSRRDVEGCGPGSPVGTLFPRTVGAALSQLVDLLAASQEAAQKVG